MGLLKTLLFILLFYYAFKALSRIFAPLALKYFVKKAGQKFGQQQPQYNSRQKKDTEGEVVIDKMPQRKTSNTSVGEYVDFEELE